MTSARSTPVDVRFLGLLAVLVEHGGSAEAVGGANPPVGTWAVRWLTPQVTGLGHLSGAGRRGPEVPSRLAARLAAQPEALRPSDRWAQAVVLSGQPAFTPRVCGRWGGDPGAHVPPMPKELRTYLAIACAWPEAPAAWSGTPWAASQVLSATWTPLLALPTAPRALAWAEWLAALGATCRTPLVAHLAEVLWRYGDALDRDPAAAPRSEAGLALTAANNDVFLARERLVREPTRPDPSATALHAASFALRSWTAGTQDGPLVALALSALARAAANEFTDPAREFEASRDELAALFAACAPARPNPGGFGAFLAGR